MDFEQKLKRIERILKKRVLKVGEHTIVAKECVDLIEQALRQLFSQHVTQLDEKDRLNVRKAETEIGKGAKGIESFTMGQLVDLLRRSRFLDVWARASGKNLDRIRLINLDELTTLRNTVLPGTREATRAEAEFLFKCLHDILETSGITSAELDEQPSEQYRSDREAAAMILKGKGTSDDHDTSLLFVSYARADDQLPSGGDEGGVTRLIKRLKTLLRQKLDSENSYDLWIDSLLNGAGHVTSEVIDTIQHTPILIVILSRNYVASDWCQGQKNSFLGLVQERARRDSSVFVIERDRLKYEERLPEFDEVTGYRYHFWDELRYHNLLDDLSYDLADELRKRKTRVDILTKDMAPVSDDRPVVLLADVTDDLCPVREEVERHLRQSNLRVLPEESYYPYETRTFQQAVRDDLVKSDLFVQLLSGVTGKRPKDLQQSRARYQYELALETGTAVVQWCSPELDVDTVHDSDQRTLLQLDTVLAVGIEALTSDIVNRVTPEKPSTPPLAPDMKTIGVLLFLDANTHQDSTLATQICQVLDQIGVGYMLPLQSEKPSENREAFEQYVLHCDALVIVYGEVSVKWVSDQLLATRKIFWKRQRPLTFAIFDGPPEQKPPLTFKFPNMRVLHCRNYVDEEKLLNFIESLAKERTISSQ